MNVLPVVKGRHEENEIMLAELAKGVNWVGYIDWTVREFHGYETRQGSTYNAYLVQDEKTALIDTVKSPYAGALLEHIRTFCDPSEIDYVVCNHAEPDHSSALPVIMKKCSKAELVCNAKCKDALAAHYDVNTWKFKVVADGEILKLGSRSLQFFNTPMVHWPESMATYIPEEGVLFSMDAFGQHMASSERFADELPIARVLEAAKTYYANIVMPYGKPVQAVLAKLGKLNLNVVAPSHGVIWRGNFKVIADYYQEWTITKAAHKVVIFFCSMWHSTETMAHAIYEGAASVEGVEVKLIDVTATHDTETVTELMDCAAFAAGSATLNMGLMPAMARTLTYVKGLHPLNKKGFAFGSYGWAEKGATLVDNVLTEMGVEKVMPPLTVRFRPDAKILQVCREAGVKLGQIAAQS